MKAFALLIWLAVTVHGRNSQGMYGQERLLCPPMESVPQPINRVMTGERIARLREEMRKSTSVGDSHHLDAYIITSADAHQSPTLAERDKRVKYISGFVGKNAFAVVTADRAVIWVDPLDAPQANEMLSCEWILMTNSKNDMSVSEWIQKRLKPRSRVGVDPTLITSSQWDILSRRINLVAVRNNLVDLVWTDRPFYPNYEAYMLPFQFTGKTWQSKLSMVREALRNEGCDALVVTALDEIAWLLNLRGKEISYFPVIRAYAVVTEHQLHLYTDGRKLGSAANGSLKIENCFSPQCARVHSYESIWGDLKTFSQIWRKVWLPGEAQFVPGASKAIIDYILPEKRMVKVSPIVTMKSIKNEVERDGMNSAHLRDAVAFCDAMAYIESKMKSGEDYDEVKIAATVDQARREQVYSGGLSFETIVAFGTHSAVPHFHTNNMTSVKVDNTSSLLIDSGGQYWDGTTDVTRTFHFGTPTQEQINIYTRSLMGLIELASAIFPEDVFIHELDILAKTPLWELGLDYDHKTGHGVGAYLSVEEGPMVIDRNYQTRERFVEGQFISVEPGHYKEDRFGIRLENVLEVVQISKNDSNQRYIGFRSATLVPFEPKLIDMKQLSPHQIIWLNNFNTRIRDDVGAELKKQMKMKGFYWMMEKAQNIPDRFLTRSSATRLVTSIFLFCFTITLTL